MNHMTSSQQQSVYVAAAVTTGPNIKGVPTVLTTVLLILTKLYRMFESVSSLC